MMHLKNSILHLFFQLEILVEQLSDEEYSMPIQSLSGATIGQHFRHVIECFEELDKGYFGGNINYDQRKRDHRLETNKRLALDKLALLGNALGRPDKPLMLHATLETEAKVSLSSTYNRELMHNLDHTVHHMALIKVGVAAFRNVLLPDSFGIAWATMKFRSEN